MDWHSAPGFTRRAFLSAGGLTAAGVALAWRSASSAGASAAQSPPEVTIVEFTDAGARGKTVRVAKIVKTDADWRTQLSDAAYRVARHEETEAPFTGPYWNHHQPGLYRCICCDTALFSSETKFDSGTGWPSFWAAIAKENILETSDLSLGMRRIAVSCRRCDAHLGHVFDDGPRPTGLRYCMNSVAMRFAKRV